jgi:PRTRC genetic system protein C
MSLSITSLERVFRFKNGNAEITLQDPNPAMSPDEVMDFFSNSYPELTTATVHGPEIENDRIIYRFKTTIGTKG